MALFLAVFLTTWGALHAYVFWRLSTLPWIANHISPLGLGITAACLWLSYFTVRSLDRKGFQRFIWPLEIIAATWVGIVFLHSQLL